MPFLRNVTAGRNVPDSRLAVVAEQYRQFGGRSPINDQNRALIRAIEADFADHGIDLPVYFGNRNWHPFIADTVRQMADDGVRNALVFVTSAFSSYSGCRQYREDLEAAAAGIGPAAPRLDKLRLFYNHPGFIDAVEDRVRSVHGPAARLVFTAHSIPMAMVPWCDYTEQLAEMAALVADRLGAPWDLVYQSRSGPPRVPWLEPDVNDHLETLAGEGVTDVTLVPIGFISDHMEVMYDLDTEAAHHAAERGMQMVRAATVGTHPRFVAGLADLVEEQLGDQAPLAAVAEPWDCSAGCCEIPARRA